MMMMTDDDDDASKTVAQVMVRVLRSCDGRRPAVEDEDDFVDEVRTLSRLSHVNVVRLIGFVAAGRPFLIAVQLPTAGSLRDYLRCASAAATSDKAALSLLRQMTRAVAYLEARRYSGVEDLTVFYKAVITTTIRFRFDCNSTALRPSDYDNLRYD